MKKLCFLRVLGTPGGNEQYYIKKQGFGFKLGCIEQTSNCIPKGYQALRPIPKYDQLIQALCVLEECAKPQTEERIPWWTDFELSKKFKRNPLRHVPGLAVLRNFRLIRKSPELYNQAVQTVKEGIRARLDAGHEKVYVLAFSLATDLSVEALSQLAEEGVLNKKNPKIVLILMGPVLNGVFLKRGFMAPSHSSITLNRVAEHVLWAIEMRHPKDIFSSYTQTHQSQKNWWQADIQSSGSILNPFERHLGVRRLKKADYLNILRSKIKSSS